MTLNKNMFRNYMLEGFVMCSSGAPGCLISNSFAIGFIIKLFTSGAVQTKKGQAQLYVRGWFITKFNLVRQLITVKSTKLATLSVGQSATVKDN